jgi:uncharacterized membrane protein YfcA
MVGYVASVFIGISLGLIGGGGSILTVPVLVYLFNVDAVVATAYSLFIVGSTSAVGSISYFRNGLVNVRAAIVFGIPSIVAVFFTRAFLLPAIPDEIIRVGSFTLTKSMFLMLLFAILMLAASYSMIKKDKDVTHGYSAKKQVNYLAILFEGMIVGLLTGLVGAGGGFLIIPALVILSNLPMKEAIGTSLIIISAKSLIGFMGEGNQTIIDWPMLMSVTAFAIAGIFIGTAISKKVNGAALKPAFGWFVLVMGIYIIIKETFLN